MLLHVIFVSMLVILLSTLAVIRLLICGNNQNWPQYLNLIYKTLFLRKNYLILDRSSHMISLAKTASKKIEALIRSMKFFSPVVALYIYQSIIQPCMGYCCHIQAGAPRCYLELLDKLQKRIRRSVGHSLAVCLEPLAHRPNVASLSLFCRY